MIIYYYHPAGNPLPASYHLLITFEDASSLSATIQMWGAMELYETGQELLRPYIQGMRPTPVDPEFRREYFETLLDELVEKEKRSAKSLLTQDQIIPSLDNAIAQDILFEARLHPRRSILELNGDQRKALYDAIRLKVKQITELGGRYDKPDLFGQPGGYVRLMDRNALNRPCPRCGGVVLCQTCQV